MLIRLKALLPKEDETKTNIEDKINNVNIKDIIKSDMKILVQVKRDGTESKGARVSTHINLPGRFVVFMPNTNFITVSQKIEKEEERKRQEEERRTARHRRRTARTAQEHLSGCIPHRRLE